MSNRRLALKEKPVRSRTFHVSLAAFESMHSDVTEPTPLRWTCYHHADGSDIEAYVLAKNGLETIAQIRQMDGVSARANAELIIRAVNAYEKYQPLVIELVNALEHCLENDNLNWAAEQEADSVCRKARRIAVL